MIEILSKIVEFFLVTVLIKAILVHWLAERIVSWFKKLFVRSEREVAIWNHYSHRARGEGHVDKSPKNCSDGLCEMV